mmetsp:Transcript_5210/g.8060  ORF Transcript_5210/g.8060 Transcript_5210/m.8060 type:complete len:124 (+) Transcript_5210:1415-1786(+)
MARLPRRLLVCLVSAVCPLSRLYNLRSDQLLLQVSVKQVHLIWSQLFQHSILDDQDLVLLSSLSDSGGSIWRCHLVRRQVPLSDLRILERRETLLIVLREPFLTEGALQGLGHRYDLGITTVK